MEQKSSTCLDVPLKVTRTSGTTTLIKKCQKSCYCSGPALSNTGKVLLQALTLSQTSPGFYVSGVQVL